MNGDAAALDRVGEDRRRDVAGPGGPGVLAGREDLAEVVAVDLEHPPAERLEGGPQVDAGPRVAAVAAVLLARHARGQPYCCMPFQSTIAVRLPAP